MKEALLRGLMAMKLEAAVARYTQRDLSVGETAELFGIPPVLLLQELARRRIPTMDVTVEEMEENLERLLARHGLGKQPRPRRRG